MAAFAQTAPRVNVAPPWPGTRPDTARALRELMRKYSRDTQYSQANVCSIPLTEVPVAKDMPRMPAFRPRAEPEGIDRMPSVSLPAPPCREEKR